MEVFIVLVTGKLKEANIVQQRIAELFGVKDDSVSVGPHILYKKCFGLLSESYHRFENTCRNVSKISVSLAFYGHIGSKSTNHSLLT